jgi:hypothetical protein
MGKVKTNDVFNKTRDAIARITIADNVRTLGYFVNATGTLVCAAQPIIENFSNLSDPLSTPPIITAEVRTHRHGTLTYEFDLIGYDGIGGIAVLQPTSGQSLPDFTKQHYLKVTDSEFHNGLRDGNDLFVYTIGTDAPEILKCHTTFPILSDYGLNSDNTAFSYDSYFAFVGYNPAFPYATPIINADGQVTGMFNIMNDALLPSRDAHLGVSSTILNIVTKTIMGGASLKFNVSTKRFLKPYTGINFYEVPSVTPSDVIDYNLTPLSHAYGLWITSVDPDTPMVGIFETDDILLSVNGIKIGRQRDEQGFFDLIWGGIPDVSSLTFEYLKQSEDWSTVHSTTATFSGYVAGDMGW